MSEKVKRSIENFELALKKLNEYLSTPVVSDRDRSGVIQAFEFTFELGNILINSLTSVKFLLKVLTGTTIFIYLNWLNIILIFQ